MKLFINGRFLTQPLTGVQRYGRELVHGIDVALADGEFADVDVTLLVPRDANVNSLELVRLRVEVVGRRRGHLWEQLDLPSALSKKLGICKNVGIAEKSREESCGSVGLLFCPANTAPGALLRRGKPVVVTLHSLSFIDEVHAYPWWFRVLYRGLTQMIVRHAARVITVSECEAARIRQHYPVLDDRLVVIDNGAVPASFERAMAEPTIVGSTVKAPFLLFVGTLSPTKNLPVAIDAFARLAGDYPDLEFRIVGGTTRAYRQDSLLIPSQLNDRIHFHGQVDDSNQLVRFYQGAAALVFPSRYESSGLPPLEALACGCPVVCSKLSVLQQRLGDAALYFEPDSSPALELQLRRLLDDSFERGRLVISGKLRACRHTWPDCARRTLRMLCGVNPVSASSAVPTTPPVATE